MSFSGCLYRLRDLDLHVHLNIEGARLVEVGRALMATGVKLVIDHFGGMSRRCVFQAPSYRGMLQMLECAECVGEDQLRVSASGGAFARLEPAGRVCAGPASTLRSGKVVVGKRCAVRGA